MPLALLAQLLLGMKPWFVFSEIGEDLRQRSPTGASRTGLASLVGPRTLCVRCGQQQSQLLARPLGCPTLQAVIPSGQ